MQTSYQLILLTFGIQICFVASQTTNVFDDNSKNLFFFFVTIIAPNQEEEATTTQCIEYYDDYTDDYVLSFSSEHSSMRPAEVQQILHVNTKKIVGLVIGGIFLLSCFITIIALLVTHRTKLKQWWQKRELSLKKDKKPKVVSEKNCSECEATNSWRRQRGIVRSSCR